MECVSWVKKDQNEFDDLLKDIYKDNSYKKAILLTVPEFMRMVPTADPLLTTLMRSANYLYIDVLSSGKFRYKDGTFSSEFYAVEATLLHTRRFTEIKPYNRIMFHIDSATGRDSGSLYISTRFGNHAHVHQLCFTNFFMKTFLEELLSFNNKHKIFDLDI